MSHRELLRLGARGGAERAAQLPGREHAGLGAPPKPALLPRHLPVAPVVRDAAPVRQVQQVLKATKQLVSDAAGRGGQRRRPRTRGAARNVVLRDASPVLAG